MMVNDGKNLRSNGKEMSFDLLYVADRIPAIHEKVEGLYNQSAEIKGLCNDHYSLYLITWPMETRTEIYKLFFLVYTELKQSLEQELTGSRRKVLAIRHHFSSNLCGIFRMDHKVKRPEY